MEKLIADGAIKRPSDGKPARKIAFIQCAGSRDENYQKHCSGVCCMGSLKQTRYVREQYPDADICVFYIDIRANQKGYEEFYERLQEEGMHFIRGKAVPLRSLSKAFRSSIVEPS